MATDHGDTARMQGAWYRSPGRPAGGDGDPFRGDDPAAQLGFHAPKGGVAPPAVDGEEGVAARRAPPAWPLGGGSDTSALLGANVHAPGADVGSEGGTEETEGETEAPGAPEEAEGTVTDEE